MLDLEIEQVNRRLAKRGVSLLLDKSASEYIKGQYDARYGARNIKRLLRNELEPLIARALNKAGPAKIFHARYAGGDLRIECPP